MTSHPAPQEQAGSRENVALGLGVLAAVLFAVAMAVAGEDDSSYGWLWPLAGVTGGAAAVTAWRSGSPRPHGKALIGLVLGGLVFLAILAWIVVAAFTGDL
ncbi:MAG: hypothetical protein Q8R60_02195 [Mycobacteriales bacterium]|nr:hypothetical protein [Mycobacteriales bacterium]